MLLNKNLLVRETSTGLFAKCLAYNRADMLQEKGAYPYFMEVQKVRGSKVVMCGADKIMLGANNYLGAADSLAVKNAAKSAMEKYGFGSGGSRLIAGTLDLYRKFEKELAVFLEREDALIFTTGYQANVGSVSCLVGRHEYVILDSEAHASLVDGARLSLAEVRRFRHNNMNDLERVLKELKGANILTIVDGVYSMGGDIANLPAIVDICKKYKSKLLVDEAHSFGVFGSRGSGIVEHFNLRSQVDIVSATFSKSCGAQGGFVAASKAVVNYIRHNARSLLFSTAMPAPTLCAAYEGFKQFVLNEGIRERLWKNTNFLKSGLQEIGFNVGNTSSPIIPVMIGDDIKTNTFWTKLFESGVFVGAMIPPAVPPNKSLLRFSCSSNLNLKDMQFVLALCARFKKELSI